MNKCVRLLATWTMQSGLRQNTEVGNTFPPQRSSQQGIWQESPRMASEFLQLSRKGKPMKQKAPVNETAIILFYFVFIYAH